MTMGKGRAQYSDHGLHRGQGEVSTEIMGQIESSTVTMGYNEDMERLVLRPWAR